MPVDLHLHSSASDGVDDPATLMDLAHAAGVSTVALTDHDTLAGIGEAADRAEVLGLRFIPGVELSVDHGSNKLHLLAYFTQPGPAPLNDTLARLRDGRTERNLAIVDRLVELGYDITIEDVLAEAGGPSVGRPHIADVLVARGAFDDRTSVFEHLLHDGGPAYVERPRLTAEEAIGLAREQDSVPVVAHPATIGARAEEMSRMFHELVDLGLGGIEAYHSMHPPALRVHLASLADDLGIAATGGSDYHGAGVRDYRIGVGRGDLRVPDESFDALEAQRKR